MTLPIDSLVPAAGLSSTATVASSIISPGPYSSPDEDLTSSSPPASASTTAPAATITPVSAAPAATPVASVTPGGPSSAATSPAKKVMPADLTDQEIENVHRNLRDYYRRINHLVHDSYIFPYMASASARVETLEKQRRNLKIQLTAYYNELVDYLDKNKNNSTPDPEITRSIQFCRETANFISRFLKRLKLAKSNFKKLIANKDAKGALLRIAHFSHHSTIVTRPIEDERNDIIQTVYTPKQNHQARLTTALQGTTPNKSRRNEFLMETHSIFGNDVTKVISLQHKEPDTERCVTEVYFNPGAVKKTSFEGQIKWAEAELKNHAAQFNTMNDDDTDIIYINGDFTKDQVKALILVAEHFGISYHNGTRFRFNELMTEKQLVGRILGDNTEGVESVCTKLLRPENKRASALNQKEVQRLESVTRFRPS